MAGTTRKIDTKEAPKAPGFYSQGIVVESCESMLFVSGQLPIDPTTGQMVEGDIQVLTKRVFENIEGILRAGGSSFDQVLRVDIFLKELKRDYAAMNEVYATYFPGTAPARQTVQVSELPLGSPIEISCIAYVG